LSAYHQEYAVRPSTLSARRRMKQKSAACAAAAWAVFPIPAHVCPPSPLHPSCSLGTRRESQISPFPPAPLPWTRCSTMGPKTRRNGGMKRNMGTMVSLSSLAMEPWREWTAAEEDGSGQSQCVPPSRESDTPRVKETEEGSMVDTKSEGN
jgi:hypothetical protein